MRFKSSTPMMMICLLIAHQAISQTILSGTYKQSMYLSLNNSPYLVVDSAIFEGPDLQIDRGVIITFKFHPDAERKAYISRISCET